MPRLWDETIAGHRSEVRDAVLDATAALVDEQGLLAVTMSQIAVRAGIGRATLYKYFPDVRAVLSAWHQRQLGTHLQELEAVRQRPGTAAERLRAALATYAHLAGGSRRHQGEDIAAALHADEHTVAARQHLRGILIDLLSEATAAGEVRDDVPPGELAGYCIAALGAAAHLGPDADGAAAERLLALVLAGLAPGGVSAGTTA